jgi:hypothetical protein
MRLAYDYNFAHMKIATLCADCGHEKRYHFPSDRITGGEVCHWYNANYDECFCKNFNSDHAGDERKYARYNDTLQQ